MNQMMIDVFIQYFNGILNHYEDPHRWKDIDYPPQNIIEIVEKRKLQNEKQFGISCNVEFVNENLVDWMKKLF